MEEALIICLLLQGRDNYTSFTEPFQLDLGSSASELVTLENGTRNTLVIIQEMAAPAYLTVRVACGVTHATALWAMID